jgi:hypothetical protein
MNFRNDQLIERMKAHPMRALLAKCLDIAEAFADQCDFVARDRDLSDQGRTKAMQTNLRNAVRDLRDARQPIDELRKTLESKRAVMKAPPFDRTDVVAALNRQELRAAMRGMDTAQRAALVTSDPAFADALLEQPPILSGLTPNEQFIVEAAQKARLETLFAPQLAEIAEIEATVNEAANIAGVARSDLQLKSGFQPIEFDAIATPIEQKLRAPWLIKSNGAAGETVMVVDVVDGVASYRQATTDESRDGKFYASEAEYLADRAA